MDNKSRDGYADAFTGCIIQGRIAKETFTFRDFIIVQFVSRDKKRRDTSTGEYWTRNRCSRQPFRVGFQTFDFGVNLRWRLRRKQWTSFTSHQSIALVTNLYIYINASCLLQWPLILFVCSRNNDPTWTRNEFLIILCDRTKDIIREFNSISFRNYR